ncbi:MAG TPA: hypothetical protein VKY92_10690 [Verrucomicrobiae bacterium]|nr:hypothetical protein [Verrucomicrobiae bacterium]
MERFGSFRFIAASVCSATLLVFHMAVRAQDNYEIQVYGSETMAPGKTMLEVHSNFAVQGQREQINGVLPSFHALHETLEITHGFTPWFETGFYVFSSIQPGRGWEWVGDHIRPRVAVPVEWHWPVGVSLSTEVGYQRRLFSEDTWNWELRPIVDKQWGRWYFAINPAVEKSIKGAGSSQGWGFAPSAKISFDLTKAVAVGAEYYGSLGPVGRFSNWSEQQQQIFPTIDLNLSPDWEFNFGVGFGLTGSTDGLLVKLILGYRF